MNQFPEIVVDATSDVPRGSWGAGIQPTHGEVTLVPWTCVDGRNGTRYPSLNCGSIRTGTFVRTCRRMIHRVASRGTNRGEARVWIDGSDNPSAGQRAMENGEILVESVDGCN